MFRSLFYIISLYWLLFLVLADSTWKLIYTTRSDVGYITKYPSGKEQKTRLTLEEHRPVFVTYDARNNIIYWTDATSNSEAIYKSSLIEKPNIEVVVDTGVSLPEGIAFDWMTGNIYFVDSNLSHIVVCRNDSSGCAVILKETINKPRGIALHPNFGIMFWTDWGITPSIMRAGMDGSLPLAIVTSNLTWPNGITVDQGSSRIYWVDARTDRMESSEVDGSDRQVLISNLNHPFGLDVFGDRIFWSDWHFYEIKSADKYNGLNSKVHLHDDNIIMNGLALFHIENQPINRPNPCERSGCSHICTLSPTEFSKFRCFCPLGMVLNDDTKTCLEQDDTQKLVIAFKDTLKSLRINTIGKYIFDTVRLPQIKSISAIVYNPINHTLIMSDSASKKTFEYDIKTKALTVLVENHLDTVKVIDIDIVGENLYWIDAGKQTVEAMSLKTRSRIVILTGMENPYDILIVPELGTLYFSTIGRGQGKIHKILLNGQNMSIFQRLEKREPIVLAYDRKLKHILWMDKMDENIEATSIDGNTVTEILEDLESPASDMVKFGNKIFWTDMFSQDLRFTTLLDNRGSQEIRKIPMGSFEGNSSSFITGQTFMGKMALINRNISSLDELRRTHECSMKNLNRKKCSHLCLLSGSGLSGFCHCPEGLTLDVDGMSCINLLKCENEQFICNDGNCIDKAYVCDGSPDCSENEDETNCKEKTCMEGYFKCEDQGVCIPGHWVCDDEKDCSNGEDERECLYAPCNKDLEFRCESDHRCIPKSWRCDYAVDCLEDNSDEKGCNFTCPTGFFRCVTSGKCIVVNWVCDNEKDCDDGSDEKNCDGKSCAPDQFTCNDRTCIEGKFRCDGLPNCVKNEDEVNCHHAAVVKEEKPEVSNSSIDTLRPVDEQGKGNDLTVVIVFGAIVIVVLVVTVAVLLLYKRKIIFIPIPEDLL